MNKANCLLFGYEMTGNIQFKNAALAQLHYILGLNSLNKSFVMSYGTNTMRHPFNCIYTVYGKPFPGWTAGGPNSYIDGADYFLTDLILAGTPKAKCYVDRAECGLGSWASNEGETSLNAALVFLSGYFYKSKSPLSNVINSGSQNIPRKHFLYQNFPNPFNPATRINFHLIKQSKLEIRIFNTVGQQIRLLVNETRSAGDYTLFWNGKDDSGKAVPSGLYVYSMKTGDFTETRKMILMK
jgi:hypothetical protein